MNLTMAANYDEALVPDLAQYPVTEVYGKFDADCVGGGRPSYLGSGISTEALGKYVAELKRHGITFNYLLNSACIGNREWTRSWEKRFSALLSKLEALDIDTLTVSVPFLLERIKRTFPDFRVKAGIFAQIDTPSRAQFWENIGADALTLESFSINRDFERLAAIRDSVKCELQVIANHCCLPNCPMQSYHQNGFAHSSNGSGRLFLDYCFLRCSQSRLEDPVLFIKSNWIRPEDLPAYERLGIDTVKLTERGLPSSEVLKRVRAYSEQHFDGNLAELLLHCGLPESAQRSSLWAARNFFRPRQCRPWKLKPVFELARQQGMLGSINPMPIQIANDKIPDDFLATVAAKNCVLNGCRTCSYCDEIAADAVTVDQDFRSMSLRKFREVMTDFHRGGLWDA